VSATLTVASIKQYVRTMLGMPVVCVEITDEQLEVLIGMAVDIYGDSKPITKMVKLPVVAGQQKYVLAVYGDGIFDVMYSDPLMVSAELSELDLWRYNNFSVVNTYPGDYYAAKMWRDEVRRAVGADFSWDYEASTHTLYLSGMPSYISDVTYIYFVHPTITEVPEYDDHWIKNYTLALTKIVVGRIRSKFGAIPGVENPIDLDGKDLIAEGNTDKDRLEKDLNLGMRVPAIKG
jgi:hypothetical protein